MIYTVTLNPALDKTVVIPGFTTNSVNRVTSLRTDPGGKGINVSKVIHSLGYESVAMGLVAGSTGKQITDALSDMGITCDFIEIEGQTRTNIKIIDPVSHSNTDINESGSAVDTGDVEKLCDRLVSKLNKNDIVVLAGSLPLYVPAETYRIFIERIHSVGAKVFLDADGDALREGIKAKPDLVKPNRYELSHLAGCPLVSNAEVLLKAKELVASGIDTVVVTLGSDGGYYINKEKSYLAKSLNVPVKSTVGAGDSVVAALAVAEIKGIPLREAAKLATSVAAATVMQDGTQPPEKTVVEDLIALTQCDEI